MNPVDWRSLDQEVSSWPPIAAMELEAMKKPAKMIQSSCEKWLCNKALLRETNG